MSGLKLNASTSLVDDEGVDLVFHRREKSTTLAVQVKSRTMATKGISQRNRVERADLADEILAAIKNLGPR